MIHVVHNIAWRLYLGNTFILEYFVSLFRGVRNIYIYMYFISCIRSNVVLIILIFIETSQLSIMSKIPEHSPLQSSTSDHLTPPDPHLHLWVRGQKSQTLKPPKSVYKTPPNPVRAMGHSQDSKILQRQAAISELSDIMPHIMQMDKYSASSDSPLASPRRYRQIFLKSIHRSNSVGDPGSSSQKW